MGAPTRAARPARPPPSGEIDIEKGRTFWAFQPPKKAAPPAVKDAAWPRERHRPLPARRAGSEGTEARRRRRPADAAPPGHLRPDRPAADARGRGRVRQGLRGQPRPRLEDGRRSAAGLAAASASAGAGTGSTWPATPSRAAETANFGLPPRLALPRLRHRRLQRATSPTTSSSASSWPATCCRPRTTGRRPSSSSPPASSPSAPRPTTSATRRQFEMDVADEQIDATFQAFQG